MNNRRTWHVGRAPFGAKPRPPRASTSSPVRLGREDRDPRPSWTVDPPDGWARSRDPRRAAVVRRARDARADASLFLDLLLQRSIDNYREAQRRDGVTVFDRGIPDCIAYAVVLGLDHGASVVASRRYRYNREVLVTEPWEEIDTFDEERTISFEDTIEFQAAIRDAYDRAGYSLVEVRRDSIANRATFMRKFVHSAGAFRR
jgi:predicted ATPase